MRNGVNVYQICVYDKSESLKGSSEFNDEIQQIQRRNIYIQCNADWVYKCYMLKNDKKKTINVVTKRT